MSEKTYFSISKLLQRAVRTPHTLTESLEDKTVKLLNAKSGNQILNSPIKGNIAMDHLVIPTVSKMVSGKSNISLNNDLSSGIGPVGGYIVGDQVTFQELIQQVSITSKLGVTSFPVGVSGDHIFPYFTTEPEAVWYNSDDVDPTLAIPEVALGAIAATNKAVTCNISLSRKLLSTNAVGRPEIDAYIIRCISTAVARAIDRAVVIGSGSGSQPIGILNSSSVNIQSLGTDGGELTFSALLDAVEDVLEANGNSTNIKAVTNMKVMKKASQELLNDTLTTIPFAILPNDSQAGFGKLGNIDTLIAAKQMPSTLTKGQGTDLSPLIVGDWTGVQVVLWGDLHVLVNPYKYSPSGEVEFVVIQNCDIAITRPKFFSVFTDIVTA